MDVLIALGVGTAAGITVLTIAWILALELKPSEEFRGLFDELSSEMDEQTAISMWSGSPVEDLIPDRPDAIHAA